MLTYDSKSSEYNFEVLITEQRNKKLHQYFNLFVQWRWILIYFICYYLQNFINCLCPDLPVAIIVSHLLFQFMRYDLEQTRKTYITHWGKHLIINWWFHFDVWWWSFTSFCCFQDTSEISSLVVLRVPWKTLFLQGEI